MYHKYLHSARALNALLMVILSVFTSSLIVEVQADVTSWSIETVDSFEQVSYYTSLALDSSDHPHISYYDDDLNALKYARWTGSEWSFAIVDSGNAVGGYTSLALDWSDHPHISYLDASTYDLKYARSNYESFSDIILTPFDSNGDGFDDAVEVAMEVDTTYSGALTVHAHVLLYNSIGTVVSRTIDPQVWSITGTDVEYGYVSLYTLPGSTPGLYDIELNLYDVDNNPEEYTYLSEAVYLYPPDMRKLTIEVDGSGTTSPLPGDHWHPNGTMIPVSALPDGGWQLDHWLLDTVNVGSDNPLNVVLEANHVVQAVFSEIPPMTVERALNCNKPVP